MEKSAGLGDFDHLGGDLVALVDGGNDEVLEGLIFGRGFALDNDDFVGVEAAEADEGAAEGCARSCGRLAGWPSCRARRGAVWVGHRRSLSGALPEDYACGGEDEDW